MGIPNRHPEKHFALCLECPLIEECNPRDPRCPVEAALESDRQQQREEMAGYPGWLSASTAAKKLGVVRETVADWCRKGKIKGAIKIRRNNATTWVMPKEEFTRLEKRTNSRELRKGLVGVPQTTPVPKNLAPERYTLGEIEKMAKAYNEVVRPYRLSNTKRPPYRVGEDLR